MAGESIGGYDARKLAHYRAHTVGFVFQFFNLLPSLTAAENVEFAIARTGTDGAEARKRAVELLELVGLGQRAHLRHRHGVSASPGSFLDAGVQ